MRSNRTACASRVSHGNINHATKVLRKLLIVAFWHPVKTGIMVADGIKSGVMTIPIRFNSCRPPHHAKLAEW